MGAEEDDGEGWAGGEGWDKSDYVDPFLGAAKSLGGAAEASGVGNERRCACATTDFAMQNVLLQMGLKLLSVQGSEVTRTKS